MTTLEKISDYTQKGRLAKVKETVAQALSESIPSREILKNGLLAGMDVIAEKYKTDEVFVPQVLLTSRAVNVGLEILKPYLISEAPKYVGTVVIGTVKGDMHDIGKNIVRIMMESRGLKVIDLGIDVSAEQFFTAARDNKADIICCSALLTATMEEMKRVVDLINDMGYHDSVKIMVGGAPITKRFCERIGADIYTVNAAEAADVAVSLCLNNRQ